MCAPSAGLCGFRREASAAVPLFKGIKKAPSKSTKAIFGAQRYSVRILGFPFRQAAKAPRNKDYFRRRRGCPLRQLV